MPVNLSIKNVPDALAARLRERAERNHRSLQGELMAILESAAEGGSAPRAESSASRYDVQPQPATAGLMGRLAAIAGEHAIDAARRLSREQAHDRRLLRKSGT